MLRTASQSRVFDPRGVSGEQGAQSDWGAHALIMCHGGIAVNEPTGVAAPRFYFRLIAALLLLPQSASPGVVTCDEASVGLITRSDAR